MMRSVACEIIRASCATPASVLILRAGRFDRVGKGEDRRQVLSELVVQFAGKRSPLVVADVEQTPGQDGALLRAPAPGGSPRSVTARPIIASSIERKRGSDVRYWPCAMPCSAATIDLRRCEGVRNCERGKQRDRGRHQQRDTDAVQDVTPGEPDRSVWICHSRDRAGGRRAGGDGPGHGGVTAKEHLARRLRTTAGRPCRSPCSGRRAASRTRCSARIGRKLPAK